MYAPHFAAALAIKGSARVPPLWALLIGAFMLDLLWIALARIGIEVFRRFPLSRLDEIVPGKPYAFRHMFCGLATHGAYHAGQIALLKKALSGAFHGLS